MQIPEHIRPVLSMLRTLTIDAGLYARLAPVLRGEKLAMLLLEEYGALQPGQLAALLHISTARVACMLKTLLLKGLILRDPDPADRRRVSIRLTDAGRQQLHTSLDPLLQQTVTLFTRFGPQKTQEFLNLLQELDDLSRQLPNQDDTLP